MVIKSIKSLKNLTLTLKDKKGEMQSKHPTVKNEQRRTKASLAEKLYYIRCPRLPIDKIKIFDKDDQTTKY